MTFARVKPLGYAFGEILPSADINQLDIDHVSAVDGVNGGDYTLGTDLRFLGAKKVHLTLSQIIGAMLISGVGHINWRWVLLSDVNQTFGVNDGDLFQVGNNAASRTYTITSTGAVAGSRVTVFTTSGTSVSDIFLVQDNAAAIVTLNKTIGATKWPWVDLVHLGSANSWTICRGLHS
jgi:hypothetical protein